MSDKLRASGWVDIDPLETEAAAEKLALAMLATSNLDTRTSVSPSDWQGDWAIAKANAAEILTKLGEENTAFLVDPETSSLIRVTWTDGRAISVRCRLIVTEAATKPQSYHPRLQQPSADNAFYTILEGNDVSTSRISVLSLSVSVARSVVEKELGLQTDVVAVFETVSSYPASAVLP